MRQRNLDEHFLLLLYLRLYAEAGRRGAALRQYQMCVDLLQRELGVEPEAETRKLYQEVVRRGSALPSAFNSQFVPVMQAPTHDAARRARPLHPVRARVEQLSDPARVGPYYFWFAQTYVALNDHRAATRYAERAIEQTDRCADGFTKGQAYFVLGLVAHVAGRPADAIENERKAILLLERGGRADIVGMLGAAHWVLGASCAVMGEIEPAFAALARSEAIADTHRNSKLANLVAFFKGELHAKLGEWSNAFACCQANVERMAGTVEAPVAAGFLASVHLEKGEADAAIALLEPALGELARAPAFYYPGLFTARLAQAYLLNRQTEQARVLAARAVALTTEANAVHAIGEARRVAGRIARLVEGDLPEAQRYLDEALATFTSSQARFEVARTRLDLAELALARGVGSAASAELEQARRLFERLAAPRYLERLERLTVQANRVEHCGK